MQTQQVQQNNLIPPINSDLVKNAMEKSKVIGKKLNGNLAGCKRSEVFSIFEKMKPQISQCLPKHITADRIIQLATNYVGNNPRLAQCSTHSIIGALMQSSILGLEPLPALGQVYFVPYQNKDKGIYEAQFQLGYKGIIRLARNSREIKMIFAEVVRKNDLFEYEKGLDPKLRHIPNMDCANADITHVYAVVHYLYGGYNFEVLNRNQIENLRQRNACQKKTICGAWLSDYDAMAKAKSIKQLSKYMPLSVELQNALSSDEKVIDEKCFTNDNSGIDISAIDFSFNDSVDDSEVIDEFVDNDGVINNEK